MQEVSLTQGTKQVRSYPVNLFAVAMMAVMQPLVCLGQFSAAPRGGTPTKTTYVRLATNANAIVVEPQIAGPKSHIAILITHPEQINNFEYFTGATFPQYGYRAMMLNYYGPETSYYEFLQPIALAIKALRAMPGVDTVILAGHSTGGPELTSYEDVAENGPAACQDAARILKCDSKGIEHLPKADGLLLVDANTGALERTLALNPAVDLAHPRVRDAHLDVFDPRNGYDPATKLANYSPEFLDMFFKAQGARANQIIDGALARYNLIEDGAGEYKDDEPLIVPGGARHINGARVQMMDHALLARTHGEHLVLKGDGSRGTQIVPSLIEAVGHPELEDTLAETTFDVTVRHYLSFQALRVLPNYRVTSDRVTGLDWRSTPNSVQGNLQGIHVPTLVLAGSCSVHMVTLETAYDLSAAKDKQMVAVEGAEHDFHPCAAKFGDTYKRAFDYMDDWLTQPQRFAGSAASSRNGL